MQNEVRVNSKHFLIILSDFSPVMSVSHDFCYNNDLVLHQESRRTCDIICFYRCVIENKTINQDRSRECVIIFVL